MHELNILITRYHGNVVHFSVEYYYSGFLTVEFESSKNYYDNKSTDIFSSYFLLFFNLVHGLQHITCPFVLR